MFSGDDTIAALATPAGTSALALLRASGPAVAELGRGIFGGVPPPRVAQHADYRDRNGQLVDDVLFTCFAAPNSYTGEDVLEISCHGNPYIAQRILEDLLKRGCRPAEAGEFTRRAFLNGRLDLSQAEAVMDLIHARSERALVAANQQLRGSLGRLIDGLIARLVEIVASIEAYIDFPDEDLPPEDAATIARKLDELRGGTDRLLATSHYGELLRGGIRTVILGQPNAGKSSLLNRLVGRERALVSLEPGTTRDYLEETIEVGPHLVRLIDTAGLNPTPSALERSGIEKTYEQANVGDLFVWVIDSTLLLPALPSPLHGLLTPDNTLAVFNKCDLATARHESLSSNFTCVQVSALTGSGVDDLIAAIVRKAESFRNEVGDEVIAINARHSTALARARDGLISAKGKILVGERFELVASDLREALSALGEIGGKVDNESILDRLFASFCIGK